MPNQTVEHAPDDPPPRVPLVSLISWVSVGGQEPTSLGLGPVTVVDVRPPADAGVALASR